MKITLTKKRIIKLLEARLGGTEGPYSLCAVSGILCYATKGEYTDPSTWIRSAGGFAVFPGSKKEPTPTWTKLRKGEVLAKISCVYEGAKDTDRRIGYEARRASALKKTLAAVKRYLPDNYREVVQVQV